MRIGRTLPPAAAPIGWKSLLSGISALFKGESELNRFSGELKNYFDKPHCFLVSSGKAALTLILQALRELHPDRDEVIIPAYTCYSVPSAIVRAGLKVKLCDIAADSFDFDFGQLRPLLDNKKLLCVIPTHLFGLPADVKRLKKMIDDPDVTVIEDAAQAMGGERQGQKLGTLGDVGFFSLGRGKAFSTVEGGIVLTDCDELSIYLKQKVRELPEYTCFAVFKLFLYTAALNILLHPNLFWIPKSLPFLKLGETIFDSDFQMKKMSSFQAGLTKDWVEKLRLFRQVRHTNTIGLLPILDVEGFNLFVERHADVPDLIRFPAEMQDDQVRTVFMDISNQRGQGIAIAYPNTINKIPELTSMFKDENYPLAEKRSKRLITFPLHPFLTRKDQQTLLLLSKFWSKSNVLKRGDSQ